MSFASDSADRTCLYLREQHSGRKRIRGSEGEDFPIAGGCRELLQDTPVLSFPNLPERR